MGEGATYEPADRDSPWSTGRVSGRCGCIAALLFAVPVGSLALLGLALGDCFSGDPCHQHDNRNLLIAAAIVTSLAALLGMGVRTIVRWWRLRGTDGAPSPWTLVWAIPVTLLLALLAIYAELGVLGLI